MPGILRLFLSLLVVFSHLSGAHSADHFGFYAVRSFFILSGIVLTKSLHETYAFDFHRFYANRLLRIVPLYALVCMITIVVIRLLPLQAGYFMPRWAFEQRADAVLQNFILLPLANGELQLRYIEPAWSLAVELVMYFFLWLGMARNIKIAAACFAVGAAYHVALLVQGADFSERYFPIAAAIFSYSAGVMIHFHYDRLAKNTRLGATCAVLWFCNTVFGYLVWGEHVLDFGFYANTLLFGLAAPFMLEFRLSEKLRERDALLGHLSYPVFLVQWLGGFAAFLLLENFEGRGVLLFYVALPIILVMAMLLHKANELMIEPLRKGLRAGPQFGSTGLNRALAEPAE